MYMMCKIWCLEVLVRRECGLMAVRQRQELGF